MMKNKFRKLLVVAIAIVMVFGVSSSALAGQNVGYSGTCANYFIASNTLSKQNDTTLQNSAASYARKDTYEAATGASSFLINNIVRSSKTGIGPYDESHKWVDSGRLYKGTCKLKIANEPSRNGGMSLTANGTFKIYS